MATFRCSPSPHGLIELGGAQLARELIEHRIDHPGLVLVDEGVGDVSVDASGHGNDLVLSGTSWTAGRF